MAPAGAQATRRKEAKARDDTPQVLSRKNLTARQKKAVDELGRDRLVDLYRQMVLIRTFEQRSEQMYQQRKIGGFLHLYMGQEAVGVGMLAGIDERDYVVTSYRDHGIALALGLPPEGLMAELFGRVDGVSRGKGGSMHFYSPEHKFLGGHGIVGGQIPVGLGAAFTAKYTESGGVSLIFFGDGAVQQGTFHESMNMAALWSLPAIFIIENNQYGMGTSINRASSVQDMTLKAPGYNMEGVTVDGMNMLDCYAVVADAVAKRRKAPAPLLIEAKTYRYRGHSISDPATYRKKEEIERYQKVDPIQQIKNLLAELDWLDGDAAKDLEREVRKQVIDAVNTADQSEEPPPEERDMHVFAT